MVAGGSKLNCCKILAILNMMMTIHKCNCTSELDHGCHDHMLVGFTYFCVVGAYHHYLRSWVGFKPMTGCTPYNLVWWKLEEGRWFLWSSLSTLSSSITNRPLIMHKLALSNYNSNHSFIYVMCYIFLF